MDLDRHLAELDEQSFTIVPGAISTNEADDLREALHRLEVELGVGPMASEFTGGMNYRVFGLQEKGERWADLWLLPALVDLAVGMLGPDPGTTRMASCCVCPHQPGQPLHTDDGEAGAIRPHPPLLCYAMLALTDFTPDNGATRLVAGSHRLAESPPRLVEPEGVPLVTAVMTRGDLLVWNGSTWHGAGPNRTDERRDGINLGYATSRTGLWSYREGAEVIA